MHHKLLPTKTNRKDKGAPQADDVVPGNAIPEAAWEIGDQFKYAYGCLLATGTVPGGKALFSAARALGILEGAASKYAAPKDRLVRLTAWSQTRSK